MRPRLLRHLHPPLQRRRLRAAPRLHRAGNPAHQPRRHHPANARPQTGRHRRLPLCGRAGRTANQRRLPPALRTTSHRRSPPPHPAGPTHGAPAGRSALRPHPRRRRKKRLPARRAHPRRRPIHPGPARTPLRARSARRPKTGRIRRQKQRLPDPAQPLCRLPARAAHGKQQPPAPMVQKLLPQPAADARMARTGEPTAARQPRTKTAPRHRPPRRAEKRAAGRRQRPAGAGKPAA